MCRLTTLAGASAPLSADPTIAVGWARFVALAEQSRALPELLAAVVDRPLVSRLVGNQVLLVDAPPPPLLLDRGQHPVRIVQHAIVDPAHPATAPLGMSTAVLVTARLPPEVRRPARRGEDTLTALLNRAGSFWTTDILRVDQVPRGTAGDECGRGAPILRLTRVLHVLGAPIALVLDEAPHPAPAARPP